MIKHRFEGTRGFFSTLTTCYQIYPGKNRAERIVLERNVRSGTMIRECPVEPVFATAKTINLKTINQQTTNHKLPNFFLP